MAGSSSRPWVLGGAAPPPPARSSPARVRHMVCRRNEQRRTADRALGRRMGGGRLRAADDEADERHEGVSGCGVARRAAAAASEEANLLWVILGAGARQQGQRKRRRFGLRRCSAAGVGGDGAGRKGAKRGMAERR